jgi:hypothetical protein
MNRIRYIHPPGRELRQCRVVVSNSLISPQPFSTFRSEDPILKRHNSARIPSIVNPPTCSPDRTRRPLIIAEQFLGFSDHTIAWSSRSGIGASFIFVSIAAAGLMAIWGAGSCNGLANTGGAVLFRDGKGIRSSFFAILSASGAGFFTSLAGLLASSLRLTGTVDTLMSLFFFGASATFGDEMMPLEEKILCPSVTVTPVPTRKRSVMTITIWRNTRLFLFSASTLARGISDKETGC